VYFLIEVILT